MTSTSLAALVASVVSRPLTAQDVLWVGVDTSGSATVSDLAAYATQVAHLHAATPARVMLMEVGSKADSTPTEVTPEVAQTLLTLREGSWTHFGGGTDLETNMATRLTQGTPPTLAALIYLTDLWDKVPDQAVLIAAGLPSDAAVVFGVAPSTELKDAKHLAAFQATAAYAHFYSLAHECTLATDEPRRKPKL